MKKHDVVGTVLKRNYLKKHDVIGTVLKRNYLKKHDVVWRAVFTFIH